MNTTSASKSLFLATIIAVFLVLPGSAQAVTPQCQLVDRVTGKVFTIYDAVNYTNKPQFIHPCIETVDIEYLSEIWPGKENLDSLPSREHVEELARINRDRGVIPIPDIEHWWKDIANHVEDYITIYNWWKSGAGDLPIGYYSTIPLRNYWGAQGGEGSSSYRSWAAQNDLLRSLGEVVDVTYPSLYTFYNDREGWKTYAEANIKEARRISRPDVPVYPFIWPRYHHSNTDGLRLTWIDRNYWRVQLETLREHADGMVIWMDVKYDWPSEGARQGWWLETLDFISDNFVQVAVGDPLPEPEPSPTPDPDAQALEISDISVEQVSNTEVRVHFSMNPPATGQTDYGTTEALGTVHGPETQFLSQHIQTIGNLQEGATYFFKVSGTTAEGAFAESSIMFLTTGSSEPVPDPQAADTIAPDAQIVDPSDGESVLQSDTVDITVNASDNDKLEKVEVFINENPRVTFVGDGPYTFGWNVDTNVGSQNRIRAQATDASGNVSSSEVVVTTVDTQEPTPDPQALEISEIWVEQVSNTKAKVYFSMNPPATGQTDYGTTEALGTVHGPETQFLSQHIQTIGNLQEGTTYFFQVSGNTEEGAYAVSNIVSFSTASSQPAPDPVDSTPPTVEIIEPGFIVTRNSTVTIVVEAQDNVGVQGVDLYINGIRETTFSGSGTHSYDWTIKGKVGQTDEILAIATDLSGNEASDLLRVKNRTAKKGQTEIIEESGAR